MFLKVLIITIVLLFTGCGSGEKGGGENNSSKYLSSEAENSMLELEAAVNDITGLANWSVAVYDYYFDNLVLNRDVNFTEKYDNKVLDCASGGSMKINGEATVAEHSGTYSLDINLSNCTVRGVMLGGKISLDINSSDINESNWSVVFDDFVVGVNRSRGSHATGKLSQQVTLSQTGRVVLNANVGSSAESIQYHNFGLRILQNDPELLVSLDGSYEILKNPFSCVKQVYSIQTFSNIKLDSIVPMLPKSGEIGINDIGYTFNADKSIDVVDGRNMWTMKAEDYRSLKCDGM